MDNYLDTIRGLYPFPSQGFEVAEGTLRFHGVRLMKLIEQYGTPLKITYLPKVSEAIQRAKAYFGAAIRKHGYEGDYIYSYCTKSSHFEFILEEVLKNEVKLELSSAFDVGIVRQLVRRGQIGKDMLIICNGYKPLRYREGITELINAGFGDCLPILDSLDELAHYAAHVQGRFGVGIRVVSDEEGKPKAQTSRMGIGHGEVMDLYREAIQPNPDCELRMLHYFVDSGMKDTAQYWAGLRKFIGQYCALRKVCPTLTSVDIGGGFPIRTSLDFEFDYAGMADEIVRIVKAICAQHQVPAPDLVTEFGYFTVGESGCMIYSVLDQKRQNEEALWYIIDGSLMNQMPDVWGRDQKFIFLAINHWERECTRLNVGGLTCDSGDHYSLARDGQPIYLPRFAPGEEQYVGFFHTGAYQETLSGYGGLQHCLIPAPKHVVVSRLPDGSISSRLFRQEQREEDMLKILGYG